jgi:hypothetical protein
VESVNFVIIFLIVIAALFALVFFTKRRFGVLGLALAAGAMLSNLWVGDLTPIIAEAGLVLIKPPLASVVAAGLTLLPAILLLVSGPTYKSMPQRVGGALAFAILAITLLLDPLGSALVIEGPGRVVYQYMVDHRTLIITAGLVLAVVDVFLTRSPRHAKSSGKH